MLERERVNRHVASLAWESGSSIKTRALAIGFEIVAPPADCLELSESAPGVSLPLDIHIKLLTPCMMQAHTDVLWLSEGYWTAALPF